jgi:hypothetical protein
VEDPLNHGATDVSSEEPADDKDPTEDDQYPLVALTATSPPSHQARKLMKIAINKEMTWTTQTIY